MDNSFATVFTVRKYPKEVLEASVERSQLADKGYPEGFTCGMVWIYITGQVS